MIKIRPKRFAFLFRRHEFCASSIMPFPSKNIVRTWLLITVVSITAHNVLGLPGGEKRFDLKIGFDLTQGANGAPSLRIRDFEDSKEFHQRANNREHGHGHDTKPTVRADSSGESDDGGSAQQQPKRDTSKEESAKSNNEEDENNSSSGEHERLSTRGLKAADYEPEESIKRSGKTPPSSDDDSETEITPSSPENT